MQAPSSSRPPTPRLQWRRPSSRVVAGCLALLAFGVRLTPVLTGGGLGSYGRYDDGVYYAGADALTFGRVPYRDFVLLHPPGILLVLAPFALLGRVTSDPTGMAVGRLAFMALGAANTALVVTLAMRWSRPAGVAGGLLYACWMPAVYGEQTTLLEPVGTTALLVALLLLVKTPRPPRVRAEVLAGVVLGLACAMKIWYVAPWAAVVAWTLVEQQWRRAVRLVVAGAGALAVVLAPFLILAGTRMLDMVVRDQLFRPQAAASRTGRLASIVGVQTLFNGHHRALLLATTIVVLALLASVAVCCVDRDARLVAVVLTVNMLVLLLSPSYFSHYAALTAAPAALVVGVAAGALWSAHRRRAIARAAFSVAVVAMLASGTAVAARPEGSRFPGAAFAAAAPAGCVVADDPQALIQMNRLSSDLRAGCRVAIDVTGITYDSLHRSGPGGQKVPRAHNAAFQRYLLQYLTSGRSFVVARRRGDGLSRETAHAIARYPSLLRSDGLTLRSVGRP